MVSSAYFQTTLPDGMENRGPDKQVRRDTYGGRIRARESSGFFARTETLGLALESVKRVTGNGG